MSGILGQPCWCKIHLSALWGWWQSGRFAMKRTELCLGLHTKVQVGLVSNSCYERSLAVMKRVDMMHHAIHKCMLTLKAVPVSWTTSYLSQIFFSICPPEPHRPNLLFKMSPWAPQSLWDQTLMKIQALRSSRTHPTAAVMVSVPWCASSSLLYMSLAARVALPAAVLATLGIVAGVASV